MKWTRFAGAMLATLSLTTAAQAGLLDLFKSSGSSKSSGCAPCCQPRSCAPTIKMPCCPKVHTYQRKVSTLKPPCCETRCAPKSCCPKSKGCCPTGKGCCPQSKGKCCAPVANGCCQQKGCCPQVKGKCCAPVGKGCCPTGKGCCPQAKGKCCAPVAKGCCPQKGGCCDKGKGCCGQQKCCNADPCVIAKLIYASQTSCYAKDRRKAIKKLSKFDCQCNPEIMTAFIYALNDADEDVREEAAESMGDQLKDNPCCCNKKITDALTAALGDCDKNVRKDAAKALAACGYEVVDGCCQGVSCDPCRKARGCAAPGGGQPTPADGMKKKGAPPVPGKVNIYRPVRLRRVDTQKSRLSNLFGLLN